MSYYKERLIAAWRFYLAPQPYPADLTRAEIYAKVITQDVGTACRKLRLAEQDWSSKMYTLRSVSGGCLFMEGNMGFQTQELGIVAALSLRGIRPERVVRRQGRASFEFGPEAEPVVRLYYDGKLTVPALAFAEALRTSKGIAINALPEPVGVG